MKECELRSVAVPVKIEKVGDELKMIQDKVGMYFACDKKEDKLSQNLEDLRDLTAEEAHGKIKSRIICNHLDCTELDCPVALGIEK